MDKENETFTTPNRNLFPLPPIDQIIEVGVIPFQNAQRWGSLIVDYYSNGIRYSRLPSFYDGIMEVAWSGYPTLDMNCNFGRNGNGILIKNVQDVIDGHYDHIKITTKRYASNIGTVSEIYEKLVSK